MWFLSGLTVAGKGAAEAVPSAITDPVIRAAAPTNATRLRRIESVCMRSPGLSGPTLRALVNVGSADAEVVLR
jgi:hypothetical protein